jgi:hypothetical protein
MIDAIKIAAKEAGLKTNGMKVAILSADDVGMDDEDENEENSGLLGGASWKESSGSKKSKTGNILKKFGNFEIWRAIWNPRNIARCFSICWWTTKRTNASRRIYNERCSYRFYGINEW